MPGSERVKLRHTCVETRKRADTFNDAKVFSGEEKAWNLCSMAVERARAASVETR